MNMNTQCSENSDVLLHLSAFCDPIGGWWVNDSTVTGPNMLYRICISPCLWGPQSPFLVVNHTVYIDQSKHKEPPTKFKEYNMNIIKGCLVF